ncbi:MAG TPA: hypothetical protein PKL06_04355 [Chitinophagales bacterium]|nr:hypothetical protein [Chitinophagales bacterium]
MKRMLTVLMVSMMTISTGKACDICGCSGAGVFNVPSSYALYNFILLRPHYAAFQATGDAHADILYSGVDAGFGIGLNRWWHVTAYIPYKYNSIYHEGVQTNLSGLGDAGVMNTFKVYSNVDSMMVKHKWTIYTKAGIELPTGKFSENFRADHLPAGVSLGSGSFDILAGARVSYAMNKHTVTLDYTGKYNTVNASAYQFGFQQTSTGLYSYTIRKPAFTFLPNAGLLVETNTGDTYHQLVESETKGTSAYAMLGCEVGKGSWVGGLQVDLPVADSFDGEVTYRPRGTIRILYLWQ